MLEIVHDLAPGADLYFATAFNGQAQFATNIEALCDVGADVIVDDVYYILEAAFQDDLIAQGSTRRLPTAVSSSRRAATAATRTTARQGSGRVTTPRGARCP